MNKKKQSLEVKLALLEYKVNNSISAKICNTYDNFILPLVIIVGALVGLTIIPISLAFWLPTVVTLDAQIKLGLFVNIIGFGMGTFIDFCLMELLVPENQINNSNKLGGKQNEKI